jgi:hypothetical protein
MDKNKTYVDVRYDISRVLYTRGYVPDFNTETPAPKDIAWQYAMSSGLGGLRLYSPKVLMTAGSSMETLVTSMLLMMAEEAHLYKDSIAGQGYLNIIRGFRVVTKMGRIPLTPEEEFWTASFQYYPARKDVECAGWRTRTENVRPVG